jgi:ribosomal protein S18 acetylase RimI-like enzyme
MNGVSQLSPTEPDFDALLAAHFDCIWGVYCDGVDALPGGGRYLWSRHIPDPEFNYAVDADPIAPERLREAAARRDRPPAMMVRQAPPSQDTYALKVQAAWMVRPLRAHAIPGPADSVVRVQAGDPPPDTFLDGFSRTETDAEANAHIERCYLPALRRGRAERAQASWHFTVVRAGAALAFGSLYKTGELAGLYNVATCADARRQRLASAITATALRTAADSGASAVFLQCAAGSAAEALYRRFGFRTVCRPWLVELAESS